MNLKTGILGGTFDPVHYGHLALAEAAGNLCDLSEIVLIPAAVPPHKQYREITDFSHRVAMLELAVREKPELHVSTIEQILPTPSFTIDTLEYLLLHSAVDIELFFIIGADAFLDILSWKNYKGVLSATHFIVFLRSGSVNRKLHELFEVLGYQKRNGYWHHKIFKKSIFSSSCVLPSVSSSEVREEIYRGHSVSTLIPEIVSKYINDNNLYSIKPF